MRVYDNPNHPQYGPVRRLWVVMAQLDMLEAAERWSRHKSTTWDQAIANLVATNPGTSESVHQRCFLEILMEGWI